MFTNATATATNSTTSTATPSKNTVCVSPEPAPTGRWSKSSNSNTIPGSSPYNTTRNSKASRFKHIRCSQGSSVRPSNAPHENANANIPPSVNDNETMSENDENKPKPDLVVDDDWKSQVEKEKSQAAAESAPDSAEQPPSAPSPGKPASEE